MGLYNDTDSTEDTFRDSKVAGKCNTIHQAKTSCHNIKQPEAQHDWSSGDLDRPFTMDDTRLSDAASVLNCWHTLQNSARDTGKKNLYRVKTPSTVPLDLLVELSLIIVCLHAATPRMLAASKCYHLMKCATSKIMLSTCQLGSP